MLACWLPVAAWAQADDAAQAQPEASAPGPSSVEIPEFFLTIQAPPAAEGWQYLDSSDAFGWDPRVFAAGWVRAIDQGQAGLCVLVQRTGAGSRPIEWAAAIRVAFEAGDGRFTEVFSEAVIVGDDEEIAYAGAQGPATLPVVGYGDQAGKVLVGVVTNGPDVIQVVATGTPDADLRSEVDRMISGLSFSATAEIAPPRASEGAENDADEEAEEGDESGPSEEPQDDIHHAMANLIMRLKGLGVEAAIEARISHLRQLDELFNGNPDSGYRIPFCRAGGDESLVQTVLLVESVYPSPNSDGARAWAFPRNRLGSVSYLALAEDPYSEEGRVFLVHKSRLSEYLERQGDLYVLDGASETEAGVSIMKWLAAHAEEGWEAFVEDFDS